MLDRHPAKPAAIDADQVAIDVLGFIASEPDPAILKWKLGKRDGTWAQG